MGFNRRTFLQQSGLGLWWLGSFLTGSFPLNSWLNKYSETLAASTSRKLALLIGINQYPQDHKLRGCVTDVELQKELLIYRFGFQPQDILTLTDKQATRENIEKAFVEHLINQVQKDDVVVFHFSGFGRQIKISQPSTSTGFITANSLIPQDGILASGKETITNDIILDLLYLLGRSLSTSKLTMILDTSYQTPQLSLSNKLCLRSYGEDSITSISKEELMFANNIQDKLKNNYKLNLNAQKIPGTILAASQKGIAAEIHSKYLNAGLFTYVLTQYLWESQPSHNIWIAMGEIAGRMAMFRAQTEKPIIESNVDKNVFPYYLFPQPQLSGQALVRSLEGDRTVNLELVGLPIHVLSNYGINSCFESQQESSKTTKIQISERQGRKAKGIILDSNLTLKEGDVLKESVRVIPRNLGLNIGLDDRLERIEKVDATSSLSSIKSITSVVNVEEHFTDCILGKYINDNGSFESYCLFSATGILLPNTIGKNPNEAVSSSVRRLIPQLKALLATKLLHLTLNQGSSTVPVNANLEIETDKGKILIQKKTFGSKEKRLINIKQNSNLEKNLAKNSLISTIPLGSEISLTINNLSNQELFIFLIEINSLGNANIYYSPQNNTIAANQNITFPEESSSLKWIVNNTKGLGQLMLIASYSPFTETLIKIAKLTNVKSELEQIITLDEPVEICQTLLKDLHIGSKISNDLISNLTDVYGLDVNQWISFNFVYEII